MIHGMAASYSWYYCYKQLWKEKEGHLTTVRKTQLRYVPVPETKREKLKNVQPTGNDDCRRSRCSRRPWYFNGVVSTVRAGRVADLSEMCRRGLRKP